MYPDKATVDVWSTKLSNLKGFSRSERVPQSLLHPQTQTHSRQQTRATFLPSAVTSASSRAHLFEDAFALAPGLLRLSSPARHLKRAGLHKTAETDGYVNKSKGVLHSGASAPPRKKGIKRSNHVRYEQRHRSSDVPHLKAEFHLGCLTVTLSGLTVTTEYHRAVINA